MTGITGLGFQSSRKKIFRRIYGGEEHMHDNYDDGDDEAGTSLAKGQKTQGACGSPRE